MLRWVTTLLVMANAGFYLWSHGHLAALGMAPVEQREPERIHAQIRPETLRLLNAPAMPVVAQPELPAPAVIETPEAPEPAHEKPEPVAAPAAPPDPIATPLPPTACWLIRGFNSDEVAPLRERMIELALPKGSWDFEEVRTGGRWVVYMGKYNAEQIARKKAELKEMKVEFRTLAQPPLGPGLALGTFSSEAAAEQGLNEVVRKGVRSARVAIDRAATVSHTLRLAEVTAEERAAVMGLGPALLGDKASEPCAK